MKRMNLATKSWKGWTLLLLMFSIFFLTNGCEGIWPLAVRYGASEESSKPVRVAILQHPLSGARQNGTLGLEREILERFAKEEGRPLQFTYFRKTRDVLNAITSGQADLAAARFDTDAAADYHLLPGPAYEEVALALVCPKLSRKEDVVSGFWQKLLGQNPPLPESVKTVLVSSEEFSQGRLTKWAQEHPQLQVQAFTPRHNESLFRALANQKGACGLVDRTQARDGVRFFSSLQIVQEMSPTVPLGFLISRDRPRLQTSLDFWFQQSARHHEIENLRELYESHFDSVDTWDTNHLFRNVNERLPNLIPHFKKIAAEFSLPWQLLAAVAYQESHWDLDAESFTGVKGLMMLTRETAEDLGVDDRTDLQQSLWGGAKYLRQLIDQQPESLAPRERLALALASYNVGSAHLQDAQVLATTLGRDPWAWRDLKKVLPLLSFPEYFDELEHGEARGQEPVDFTNRVLSFFDLLNNFY